ncbi:MAG TPA: tetratricopeptide repeat protein, partial [Terriglobia bacterium]|nr:tetratricopeptide repeat protein [Terriglobia bacterium]
MDDAIAGFQKAVRLQPDSAEAHSSLGTALLRNGDADDAKAEFKRTLELRPDSYVATFGLGQALLKQKSFEQAVAGFRDALRLRPSSAEAQHHLGLALQGKGDPNGAIAAFEAALAQDASYEPARESLNGIRQRRETARSAVLDLSGVDFSTIPSSDPMAESIQGDLQQLRTIESFSRQEKFKEVEPLVLDYLSGHPNSWWGHYALGYALLGQRRIGDSIKELTRSLQLNIRNAEAHK